MANSSDRIQALQLLERAIQLRQTGSAANVSEIEKCLTDALALGPESIDILGEVAGFYNSIGNSAKARQYAAACGKKAEQIAAELRTLLGESRSKTNPPASRHIGGIIGPY